MKNVIYPLYFETNECIHCGAKNLLIYVDNRGITTRHPVYPVEYIKCLKCGTEYVPKWIMNENNKMIASCTGNSSIKDFEKKIISYSIENTRKLE